MDMIEIIVLMICFDARVLGFDVDGCGDALTCMSFI